MHRRMMNTPGAESAFVYRPAARTLSLLLASPLALLLLIHPAAMLDGQGGYSHPQLLLVMWGISAGFVHASGSFRPIARCVGASGRCRPGACARWAIGFWLERCWGSDARRFVAVHSSQLDQ